MNTTKSRLFERPASAKLNKRGAEMALNMIITIIILLLVVVVVVVLIANATGKWNTGTDCISKGGRCVVSCTDPVPNSLDACPTLEQTCCKIISGS